MKIYLCICQLWLFTTTHTVWKLQRKFPIGCKVSTCSQLSAYTYKRYGYFLPKSDWVRNIFCSKPGLCSFCASFTYAFEKKTWCCIGIDKVDTLVLITIIRRQKPLITVMNFCRCSESFLAFELYPFIRVLSFWVISLYQGVVCLSTNVSINDHCPWCRN